MAVRLNSFDLAGWFVDYQDQPLIIYDENYNVLLNLGPILVLGSRGHTTVTPNLTHNSIIRIQFGRMETDGFPRTAWTPISAFSSKTQRVDTGGR